MSKMGTSFRKGRRVRKLLALSLVLAVVLALAGVATASAALGGYASFIPTVAGKTQQDAIYDCSASDVVSFKTNKIFWFDTSKATSINRVYAFKVTLKEGSALKLNLDAETGGNSRWRDLGYVNGDTRVFTYRSPDPISAGTFNDLMAMLSVTFEPQKGEKYASGAATITAYSSQTIYDSPSYSNAITSYVNGKPCTTFTCTLAFYTYAKGRLEAASADMDYKTDYAADYDQPYSAAVPDGRVNSGIAVNPENANNGKASFDLYISDRGDGENITTDGGTTGSFANKAAVGYQMKLKSESWTDKVPKIYVRDGDDAIDLKTWQLDQAIHIEVEGLNAGQDYEIRGVVATDLKYDSPQYTSSLTFRYNRPNINSFNIGSTTTVYKGGQDTMNISMLSTFNDTNALGRSYTDKNGKTQNGYIGTDGMRHEGPALSAELYFTPNRNFTTVTVDGKEIPQEDQSVWYHMPTRLTPAVTKEMMDGEGVVANTFQTSWQNVTMPETLYDITGKASDKNTTIDTKTAAFKLVVTDLYTGYTAVSYSDPFTIDSTPPSGLTIKTADGEENLEPSVAKTVGGSDANVLIQIGGASDGNGSGIKEYRYSMYYLPTDAVPSTVKTTADVLAKIAEGGKNLSGVEYTDWAPAADAYKRDENGVADETKPIENTTEVLLSKDGYYRIDAMVVDNAGYQSEEIESAYFRVDRSLPSQPKVCLMKEENGSLTAYDGRTYTNSTVWLFAYSEPQTGKPLKSFEYTTDGANWKTMAVKGDATTTTRKVASNFDDAETFGTVNPYNASYTGTEPFIYQVGVNVTAMKEEDYTYFQVRVTDAYGNRSLLSSKVEMRTVIETPKPTSVLEHQDIELALAVGNTTMETSGLIKDIKNAAAKKINAAYYGINSDEYKAIAGHTCNWGDDSACIGACHDTNCPYKTAGYEYFTPEMVGVQGVSADPTDQSNFEWVKYDHTMFNKMSDGHGNTVQIPTVSYTSNEKCITNLKPNTSSDHFTYGGKTIYTASQDRVVYMGQTDATLVDANGLPTEDYNSDSDPSNVPKTPLLGFYSRNGNLFQWYVSTGGGGFPANGTAIAARTINDSGYTYSWNARTYTSISAVDTYNKAGHYYKENSYPEYWEIWHYPDGTADPCYGWGEATIARRIYHMIDLSTATTANKADGYADLSKKGDMSTIAGYNGYVIGSERDFTLVYNNQPTRKTISFSVNDSQVNAHSGDFDGFLFNTSIRQDTDGEWRLSGYMFMDGDYTVEYTGVPRPPKNYKWWIIKINDVNLDQFCDGCLKVGGDPTYYYPGQKNPSAVTDDIPLFMITDPTLQGYVGHDSTAAPNPLPGGGNLETVAFSEHDTTAVGTRHYKLVIEGNYTTVYVFNNNGNWTTDSLETKFASSDKAVVAMPSSATTGGYKAIQWKMSYSNSNTYTNSNIPAERNNGATLYTPRPSVDGVRIGTYWARTQSKHTDTNCYGFGPICGARTNQHGCYIDSRVVFSNVSLKQDVARTLAEVVNEPQWGGSSAKFIANISDDSTEDFANPILSSQVQWRLFKDNAKFIGWGGYDNKVATENFLKRIEGEGTFVANVTNVQYTDAAKTIPQRDGQDATDKSNYDGNVVGTAVPVATQVDQVAEYITRQYYESLGYSIGTGAIGTGTPVVELVQNKIGAVDSNGNIVGKGAVYTMDEIRNLNFSVTPERYATSSANKDFPQGRWYIVRDSQGFEKTSTNVDENGKGVVIGSYSDALDLQITEPGRYTVYFAPDANKIANNTLDPKDSTCIFDFVVNTPPVAQFTGSIVGDVVHITDDSYDPDNNLTVSSGNTATTVGGVNISGVDQNKTQWRVSLLGTHLNTITMMDEVYSIYDTGWTTESPDGKNISYLTKNTCTSVAEGQVLTVYQRVYDYNAHREFTGTGYRYTQLSGTASTVLQQNLTSGAEATYAPLSAFKVSTVNTYDTAKDTYQVEVTRSSKQTQGKAFKLSWAVDYDGTYRKLAWDTSTNNFYLCSAAWYDAEAQRKKDAGDSYTEPNMARGSLAELQRDFGVNNPICAGLSNTPILTFKFGDPQLTETNPSLDEANDIWYITKGVISKLKGGNFGDTQKVVLQITETARGYSQTETLKPSGTWQESDITNSSARAIYYKKDQKAPSIQNVEVKTLDSTTGKLTDYAASNYLDVSTNQQFIQLTVGGSVDSEGEVAGYKYYFYTLDASGNENTNGQYYKFNAANGTLTPVTTRKDALSDLGPGGGTIKIGQAAMQKKPTDSLNVAIFAYDNQTSGGKSPTGVDNLTEANETARTRIQEIKLSVSEPMAPAISVKNALSQNVTKIGNDNGFENGNSALDQQSSDLQYYSNTAVTVEFTPRQAQYALDSNGQLVLHPSSPTTYFQDIYGAADLTGVNDVLYTVRYKPERTGSWWTEDDFKKANKPAYGTDVRIPNTQTLTLTDDGVYELTAKVINGSGIVSASRTVDFTIDKTAPTAPTVRITYDEGKLYSSGTWVKGVRLDISGSEDTNASTAKYQISTDGGKTWKIELHGDITTDKEYRFEEDGEYTVLVRAIDLAGNSSSQMELIDPSTTQEEMNNGTFKYYLTSSPITIRVDQTAPDTPGPTLTATSEETRIMDNCLVRISGFEPEQGTVCSVQDSVVNTKDTQVIVPAAGNVRFEFRPAEGYRLGAVTCTDVDEYGIEKPGQSMNIEPEYDNNAECYYYNMEAVKSDKNLVVTFVPEEVEDQATYLSVARHAFAMRSAMAVMLLEEGPDDGTEDSGTEEQVLYTVTAEARTPFGEVEALLNEVPENTEVLVKIQPWEHSKVSRITSKTDGGSEEDLPLDDLYQDQEDGSWYYKVTVTGNTEIGVYFEEVAYRSLNLTTSDCGSVYLQGTGVEDMGGGVYQADVETTVIINMTPDSSYTVKSLQIGDQTWPSEEDSTIPTSFTVPAYDGEGADPGIPIHVEFDVAADKFPRTFTVTVAPDGNGDTHGTVTPSGTVLIPGTGSRTFTVKPDARYFISNVTMTQTIAEDLDITNPTLTQVPGTNMYTFTVQTPQSNGEILVEFEENSYKLTREVKEGMGDIAVRLSDDTSFSDLHVPEGKDLIITPRAASGYMLRELIITQDSKQYSVGAVTSYVLKGISGDVTIQAYFQERKVSKIETKHKITAVANNVKDANDALADQPYRFKISDGENESEPSEWSAKNDIEYTGILVKGATEEIPLLPNKKYYVYVQTRDRVGNQSEWQVSSVYTQANMPGLTSIEVIDDGNPTYRSVSVEIEPNDNPEDTEYQIYYSLSSSMEPMSIANEDDGNEGWATLTNGRFEVNKLDPGNRYYFKVVARNHVDLHHSSISEDTINVMLSPAAPALNSFYFDDQESPGGPVKLYWDTISGDVKAVQIYLDGTPLAEVDAGLKSYTDYTNIMANAVGRYSYAYVNAAGAGSSCVAVSMEYHEALFGDTEEDTAKLAKMDKLKKDADYDQMFSDTLTYPAFPTQIKKNSSNIRASIPIYESAGKIEMRMDDTPSNNIARYQNYKLTLKAFQRKVDGEGNDILDENGNPTYDEITDVKAWDKEGKYTDAEGNQIPNSATIRRINAEPGSWVVWEGLNPDYEYQVFVEEIRSTGPASANNGIAGQEKGVEVTLGKTYVVNKEGYSYTYTSDNTEPKLITRSGEWTDDELAKYTYDQGWDVPINEGYIAFNKSPAVALANPDDVYYDNDAEKVRTDENGQYILIDQSMSDMTFHINVAVWDKDIREGRAPYVRGVISDVQGESDPKLTEESVFPAGEDIAKQRENLYRVTFDASGLPTGVYDTMTIKAFDGDTETALPVPIRLVVNRNTPESTVTNGTKQLVQKGESYDRSKMLAINTAVAKDTSASTQLSKVALVILPDECKNALGSNSYEELHQKLCVDGDPTFMAKIDALLGDDAAKYKTGGKLTEEGLNVAITRVSTPVSYYVNIEESQYNSLIATPGNSQYLREVAGRYESSYWAELDFALNNGLCGWLSRTGNALTPIAEVTNETSQDTYTIRMVASFGGNTSAQSVDYVVKNAPSAEIQSEKVFGWVATSSTKEYEAYGSIFMQTVLDKYKDAYEGITPDYGKFAGADFSSTPAAYEENGVKYVFKPTDKKATLGMNFINGYLNIDLGVYDKFLRAGVLASSDKDFDPNGEIDESTIVRADIKEGGEITSSGLYNFNSANLKEDTTYYFWSYYTLPNEVTVYSKSYQAMTTMEDYEVASFGFRSVYASYKEADYADTSGSIPLDISKLGHKETSGVLRVTAKYYEADQYGEFVLDDNSQKKELEGEKLEAAKKTLTFTDSPDPQSNYTLVTMTTTTQSVYLRLNDTNDEQGHMIMRLYLSVEENLNGYCNIREEDAYTDIHLVDDESKITSYIIGLMNEDGALTEINEGSEHYYTYSYQSLPVNYTQMGNLRLTYVNDGEGDLDNISVAVYDDKELSTPSKRFEAGQPSDKNLKKAWNGYGTVDIHPIANLEDGVYEAWVVLTADYVEPKDRVVVRIRQVVGQSTLTGRIYITGTGATNSDRTGQAKILLYRYEDVQTITDPVTGKKSTVVISGRLPLYEGVSDEYGGQYTIPNILNRGSFGSSGQYYIVVERDGFVTYDNLEFNRANDSYGSTPMLVLGETSSTYNLDIHLRGGDVNQDQKIDDEDLRLLTQFYYNREVNPEGTSEEDAYIRRCDFNQDGMVNALDRAYLISNLGTTGKTYDYGQLMPAE